MQALSCYAISMKNKKVPTFTKQVTSFTRSQCVILDMDSTLSEPVGDDWANVANHKPIEPILSLAQMLHDHGYDLVISTARPESSRPDTVQWLEKYLPQFAALYMRPQYVKTVTMKEDALLDIDENWDVAFAIDDSPFNAQIFTDHGVLCMRPMTNEDYWEEVRLSELAAS